MKIGNKSILSNSKPLLIAEIGINHNGDIELAKKMTNSAIDNGADIVKFQTHLVDEEMLNFEEKKKASHVKGSLYEILKKCSLDLKSHLELKKLCEKRKKIFLSTPFSIKAVDLLSNIGVKAFKIGSGETNNHHFVEYILKKKKPTLISTGTSNWKDLENLNKKFLNFKKNIILLHCVSNYPTSLKDANVKIIEKIKNELNFIPGFSDHSIDNYSSTAAVVCGAKVIERHYTISRSLPGIDQQASIEPHEFKDLRNTIDKIFQTLGSRKQVNNEASKVIKGFSQSIVSIKKIKRGQKLIAGLNIWYKRPGSGINCNKLFEIDGKIAKKNINKNKLINLFDFKK